MKIRRIYLDMDGVLADWADSCLQILGKTWEDVRAKWPPGQGPKLHEGLGVTYAELERTIAIYGDRFWATLPEFPWTRSLFYTCSDIAPTCILTSPTNLYGIQGKIQWLRTMFGDDFKNVLIGDTKEFCAAPGHVLIDDQEVKCDRFREFGGDAILFPQYWNSRHALWPQAAAQTTMNELRELGGIK